MQGLLQWQRLDINKNVDHWRYNSRAGADTGRRRWYSTRRQQQRQLYKQGSTAHLTDFPVRWRLFQIWCKKKILFFSYLFISHFIYLLNQTNKQTNKQTGEPPLRGIVCVLFVRAQYALLGSLPIQGLGELWREIFASEQQAVCDLQSRRGLSPAAHRFGLRVAAVWLEAFWQGRRVHAQSESRAEIAQGQGERFKERVQVAVHQFANDCARQLILRQFGQHFKEHHLRRQIQSEF